MKRRPDPPCTTIWDVAAAHIARSRTARANTAESDVIISDALRAIDSLITQAPWKTGAPS